MVKTERIQVLKEGEKSNGPVVYWMSRDQRAEDNWALLYAQEIAIKIKQSLAVVFCLIPDFPGATLRHYDFMIKGLEEVVSLLKLKNIPFYLLSGNPAEVIQSFILQHDVKSVVTDFDPLRIKRAWKEDLIKKTNVTIYEVDAHNIVPCKAASQKAEFGAFTIRPKIQKLLSNFLDEFPNLIFQKNTGNFVLQDPDWQSAMHLNWKGISGPTITSTKPGSKAAAFALNNFMNHKLEKYNEKRNDPNEDFCSNLSPYLHFGHISSQRVAIEIIKNLKSNVGTDSFLEELIIRRELSDNYCYYNPEYDSFAGFPAWARKTLDEHRKDEREYLYSFDRFESAKTHDPLWNAAQMEMVKTGKMHGYMRMYWAKKILEWTQSPEEALDFSIHLNDRYQLDGRDPNGYVGCAWSIGGVHDRAWAERPVYGKIRYMNYNGCKRKFDIQKYINLWL